MTINEMMTLALAWLAGTALGAVFFGGLWWTVRKAVLSPHPVLWFFGSLMLRLSIVLTGFYVVTHGQWQRLLLCLLGFVMARVAVIWLTRQPDANPARPDRGAVHAP